MIRAITGLALLLLAMGASNADPRDGVRHIMMATFDKPESRLVVDPVVIESDYAIAGWSQGDMGGRALLRAKHDTWTIVLCAGDQLLDPKALLHAGLTDHAAKRLVAAAKAAEARIAPERVSMFARFEGLVSMEGHSTHHSQHPQGTKP